MAYAQADMPISVDVSFIRENRKKMLDMREKSKWIGLDFKYSSIAVALRAEKVILAIAKNENR